MLLDGRDTLAGMTDLAEKLVSNNVETYLRHFYNSTVYNYSPKVFTDEDVAEYVRVYSAPGFSITARALTKTWRT